MIKASHLRIGNIIYYPHIEEVDEAGNGWVEDHDKVISLDINLVSSLWMGGGSYQSESQIIAVELTEHILTHYGFSKIDNPNNTPYWCYIKDGEIWAYQDWKNGRISVKKFHSNQPEYVFLHELQNLYFMLTGKEL
jgi:hypothetical protein